MTAVDLTRLPTGQLSWAALIDWAASSDDRVERYFLEVKSSVDLSTNAGRAKVAKFILGAANRDPDQAAKHFGGHAVMLLGVGSGSVSGIERFEAMDLARFVTKIIGTDGPRWDFERVPAEGGRDVIAIQVDPPTGEVWTCRADADGLTDGTIYVRADGETRKATGDEVRLMLTRARSAIPNVHIDVSIVGHVHGVVVDTPFLSDMVQGEAERLRRLALPSSYPNARRAAYVGMGREMRKKPDYLQDVDAWREDAIADPLGGVRALASHVLPGIQLRVVNHTARYLRDVRIEVELDETIQALEWEDPADVDTVRRFAGAPRAWGNDTMLASMLGSTAYTPLAPRDDHGIVYITSDSPPGLLMAMNDLRPEQTFTSDDDDVVLALLGESVETTSVRGTWRMTAADVNEVFSGEFEVPVEIHDWRDRLRRWYAPPIPQDDD